MNQTRPRRASPKIDLLIPFVLPDTLTDGMRMGAGILRQVTGSANTDISIVHNLGRIPHFVVPLDNGTSYVPKFKRSSVTSWTSTTVNGQFDVTPSSCWVWIV